MTKRTDAHRAADARYEAKGRKNVRVLVTLTPAQAAELDAKRHPNETRPAALLRLAGLTPANIAAAGIQRNDGSINDE